jgi:hypothetical protein
MAYVVAAEINLVYLMNPVVMETVVHPLIQSVVMESVVQLGSVVMESVVH